MIQIAKKDVWRWVYFAEPSGVGQVHPSLSKNCFSSLQCGEGRHAHWSMSTALRSGEMRHSGAPNHACNIGPANQGGTQSGRLASKTCQFTFVDTMYNIHRCCEWLCEKPRTVSKPALTRRATTLRGPGLEQQAAISQRCQADGRKPAVWTLAVGQQCTTFCSSCDQTRGGLCWQTGICFGWTVLLTRHLVSKGASTAHPTCMAEEGSGLRRLFLAKRALTSLNSLQTCHTSS